MRTYCTSCDIEIAYERVFSHGSSKFSPHVTISGVYPLYSQSGSYVYSRGFLILTDLNDSGVIRAPEF